MVDSEPVAALLPSPLLGPATWLPVADRLRAEGRRVAVCSIDRPMRVPADVVESFSAQLPLGPLILVAHSNAGAFVPELCSRRDVRAAVFVDAVLPGAGAQPMAPPGLMDFLRGLADGDGVLPEWTRWWDPADVAPLFPDDDSRQRVVAEQQRLPLAYFESSLPMPERWDDVPAAYLAFGDTYGAELGRARSAGWPTARLPGAHLHQLVAPGDVASAIQSLLAELSDPSA